MTTPPQVRAACSYSWCLLGGREGEGREGGKGEREGYHDKAVYMYMYVLKFINLYKDRK